MTARRYTLALPLVLGLTAGSGLIAACGGGEDVSGTSGDPGSSGSTTTGEPSLPSTGTSSGASGSDGAGASSGQPAAPKAVRFVAIGDTGTGTAAQKKVGDAIATVCKARGCDFVQLLGDNIYDSGVSSVDDPLWQTAFEIPYAAVNQDFYAVLGNHDYGHSGLGTDFGKGTHEIAYTTKSKKWKMPGAYYQHVPPVGANNVHIFALDTNMQMFGQDDDQKADVAAWIAASTSEWKIAVGHHPYKSNGPHGNAGKYDKLFFPADGSGVKDFLEEVVCGKVDLYLSGHDHSRQWLNESCMGTELAVSGAGAKATKLDGSNPALFQSLELGFLYVVVEGKTLRAEFIDESGTVEFTHTMKK